MPQYMMLIYTPPEAPQDVSPEEMMGRWVEYTETLQRDGVLVAGDALQPPDTATTVRVRDGQTQFTDGPFAETKEYLGGYYLIDCPDLDTALRYAERIPNVHYGSTEVRPLMAVPASARA